MNVDRYDYPDLDYELDQLTQRAVERIAEKESEHEPAEWRDDNPMHHIDLAQQQFDDIRVAAAADDLEAARTQAADAVNHLLMALSLIPSEEYFHAAPEQAAGSGGADR